MWEALKNRSYKTIDLSDEEDVVCLLYTMYLCGGNKPVSRDVFDMAITSKIALRDIMCEVETQINLSNELSNPIMPYNTIVKEGEEMESDSESEELFMTPVVARLISEGGIDARYVMYDMGVWELTMHLKALEAKRHEQMEKERLWVYYLLSPHLDHKKVKSPKDLLRLPKEQIEQGEEDIIQDELYKALKGGLI